MKKILKTPVWLFTICMAVALVFSLFANMALTSLYSVKVEKITFETERNNGEMEALLYMPSTCSEENPCPVIVTTHGYLNSKEMQDAPSVELSKRGYIVLAVDMYDHGGSEWDSPGSFSFYGYSLWDAAQYAYKQKWALKDANNNGMIAVSGHSMGGFSTEMAVFWDEMYSAYQGHRKIAVALSVAADYRYTYYYTYKDLDGDPKTQTNAEILAAIKSFTDLYGTRSYGHVMGHYDDFFGDGDVNSTDTVVYKNYIETDEMQYFLGNGANLAAGEEYQAGVIYENNGGQRVVYTPNEIHPWNHFSTETTAYMIEYYDAAFEYQLNEAGLANTFSGKDVKGQTWWLKEACECVALIALLTAVVPAFSMLLKVPLFAKVVTKKEENETSEGEVVAKKEVSKTKKIGYVLVALLTSLIPAYYFSTFYNRKTINMEEVSGLGEALLGHTVSLATFTKLAETIIVVALVLALGAWLISLAVKAFKPENSENARSVAWDVTKGALWVGLAAVTLRYLTVNAGDFFANSKYYNATTVSSIGYWALISASISALVLVIVHQVARKQDGATLKDYGVVASIKQIALALLLAVILFVGLYLVVFLVGWIFHTDFRLWVYAIKSFEWKHVVSFVRYVPAYFVFYFINSVVVAANTKDVKGWKGYAYALFLNVGGLLLLLGYHYGKLFITGEAGIPNLALPIILVFGLIPSLAIAAIYARKFYEKTNNVWTSAFFNTFLFTMIAVANTIVLTYVM